MTPSSPSSSPAKTIQVDSLPVRVYRTELEMAQEVAIIAQDHLQKVISQQGKARVILATGNSQINFLEALIALGGVEWSKLTLFHMDEYLGISRDHTASFRKYMRERVEARVRPGQFHYLEGDALQPLDECVR
ncbi:MAG TPA: 6-phosphogluconolactonase, partial [Verrucomicrobiae bacterium]|nr:6-phosphogluconolactonase [Verrucomicrobiae bacterium]